jgi:hypothetical protein
MVTPTGQVSCLVVKLRAKSVLGVAADALRTCQAWAAVADQVRGQVGPVDVQFGQGQPGGVQIGLDAAGDAGLQRVGRGDAHSGDQAKSG